MRPEHAPPLVMEAMTKPGESEVQSLGEELKHQQALSNCTSEGKQGQSNGNHGKTRAKTLVQRTGSMAVNINFL